VLFYVLGGNVFYWVFYVAIYIVGSFTWQNVLYVLGDNVCCSVFYVAMCFVGLLSGNVCCSDF